MEKGDWLHHSQLTCGMLEMPLIEVCCTTNIKSTNIKSANIIVIGFWQNPPVMHKDNYLENIIE